MDQRDLIPHLFRTEYSKIVAVLCKNFGFVNLENVEDITSETFMTAIHTWTYNGIPENPVAWLYTVAKNKAFNYFHREVTIKNKVHAEIQRERDNREFIDLSENNIADSQLRMLFAVCHPAISDDAQIGLALRILCGFGIDEIANAFLTNKETINKRLLRAKDKIRSENIELVVPLETELVKRLERVLTALYLLFNEGYYSESQAVIVRKELCFEAMRLVKLLLDNPGTNLPEVNALMALMCFHSSRLDARTSDDGFIVLLEDQDRTKWNYDLIALGVDYMKHASLGARLSKYHLEAGIAYWHTVSDENSSKWDNILQLYNQLLIVSYSPIAALNRTVALSKVKGATAAIIEAEKLQLTTNQYYFVLLGELYKDIDGEKARTHFEHALELTRNLAERALITNKINSL